ncbi:MAG: tetratricopeptide repeat protein, partial [candidate division Zixibacteria bacterium]|nr:tetratricopeptide repeat protein [candidate division Zixibacteria bacterium]
PYSEAAMAYVNINGFEEATKLFEEVLAIPYEPRDIYFYYGKSLWGIRDYVKSGDVLVKHLGWVEAQESDNPSRVNDAELYQLLGDSYYYRKPNDFALAIKYYSKSIAISPEQKRILQNIAVAYHSMKSYRQAIEYYNRRIELGIDSASASIYKNAGYCALNIANNEGGSDDMELEEVEEDVEAAPVGDADVNYYQVAANFMEKYLQYEPVDAKVLMMMGNTYLFQLADCSNGVKYFEQLLAVEPTSCDAKKALGYAYFGGVCTKNYTRALGYLSDAYSCITKTGDACSDADLILWIAQCYHLRAADKEKAEAKDDFRNANEWYHKGKKCNPTNPAFDEGIKQTQFEF